MPNDTTTTPVNTENPSVSSPESFLKSTHGTDAANPYEDFFQETSDGNISIWSKARKSGLEIATEILWYVVPVTIFIAVLWVIHVFIRTQENSTFAENYTFLCPYLNMGIDLEDKECKTMKMIQDDYAKRTDKLNQEILTGLTEYIPIKISKNIIDASPERDFIFRTFKNKIFVDDIMDQFEKIRITSSYWDSENIICKWISITNGDTLSTQCTVYGWKIGADDSNNRLGSARIEALSFLDDLANTTKSQFILLNPPSSLSVEFLQAWEDTTNPLFETKTTLQIQVRYVTFNKKS